MLIIITYVTSTRPECLMDVHNSAPPVFVRVTPICLQEFLQHSLTTLEPVPQLQNLLQGFQKFLHLHQFLQQSQPIILGSQHNHTWNPTQRTHPVLEILLEGVHQHDVVDDPVHRGGLREVSLHQAGVFWLVDVLSDLRDHGLEEPIVVHTINTGTNIDCELFLPLMGDEELPDSWLLGVLINPGGDDLTDGCPPVLRPGLQDPVVVVGRQHRGEQTLVMITTHHSLGAQHERFVSGQIIILGPVLQQ